jgi:hypothetical protein
MSGGDPLIRGIQSMAHLEIVAPAASQRVAFLTCPEMTYDRSKSTVDELSWRFRNGQLKTQVLNRPRKRGNSSA